jgi:hypothetical protein
LLVVADRQDPVLAGGFTIVGRPASVRVAIDLRALFAMITDQSPHVDRSIPAYDNVLAARSYGEAGPYGNCVVAWVADDLQAAHGARTVQVTVVEPVLRDDVMVKTSQILVGQQLAGEEPGAAEALEPVARCSGLTAAAFMIEGLSHAAGRE